MLTTLHKSRSSSLGLVLVLTLTLSAFQCNNSTRNLAVASRAISHALLNAQAASQQAVIAGVISSEDDSQFEILLSKAAQTGLILDQAIRNGEGASGVSDKVNVFLTAFDELNKAGVAIKNPQLKVTITTILTTAEASVAVIVASVGKGGK